MTYASTIIADGPMAYFKLEETGVSSTTTPANSGSAGGTGTMVYGGSGAITTSTGAGTIGGGSWHFNNNQVYGTKSLSPGNSDFTMETWYKWDTAFGTKPSSSMTILNNNGFGHAIQFAIGATAKQVLVGNSGVGYAINQTITPNLTDGSWHHIAVTQSADVLTLYVDGVSVATGSGAQTGTNSTTDFQFGGVGSNGADCWLDEVAFYNKVLTGTQIANHYTVGTTVPSVPVTVTAPVMNMTNLTVPAPKVGVHTTSVAPVMTMALAAPSGVVDITNSIESVAPETMSLSMPTPNVFWVGDSSNSASAMTLSLATVTPSVGITVSLAATATQDVFGSSGYISLVPSSNTTWGGEALFTVPTYADKAARTAKLTVTYIGLFQSGTAYTTTVPTTFNIYRVTQAWASGSAGANPSVDLSTVLGSFTIPSGTDGWRNAASYTVDISTVLSAWQSGATNYGVAIRPAPGTTYDNKSYHFSGAGTGTVAPRLDVTYSTVSTTLVAVPPMDALSLTTVAPVVSETSNVTAAAPAMGMALAFAGGISYNPDFAFTAPVMTAGLATADPAVSIQYPVVAAVPPMTLSLGTVAATVNLTTNVLKVAPVMGMSLNMVGIFDAAHDRYLNRIISSQLNPLDIWYKLDEASGTTAVDSSFGYGTSTPPNVVGQQNGSYHGAYTQVIDGPQLRKGVHFNGTSSFLVMGAYGDSSQNTTDWGTAHALTVEFSIRTTQTDGVVFIGNGFVQRAQSANGPEINGNELRLEAGQLVIVDGTGKKVKVRKNISDGQWHHVVFAIPQYQDGGGSPIDPTQPAYVMVDGDHALVRYSTFLGGSTNYGGQWLPYTVMARATKLTGDLAPNGFLQGDLSNFIVRNNGYLTTDQAQSIYYEWSDANIISPAPITLALETETPKVKGSVKKMLALYGLPFVMGHGAPAVGQPGDSLYQYLDVLSGLIVRNLGGSINTQSTGFLGGRSWAAPESFMMDDYFVVPVSIFGNLNGDNSYAMSTNGTLNPDAPVTVNGIFVDDETGHPRFINLQDDLSVDVTEEYDVITAVNYPWEKPYDTSVGEYNYITPYHGFGNMTAAQWEQARDDLRDSIMEAVYDGCSMWIGDYYMAQHLGFIQGYDIHDFNRFSRDTNTRATQLDQANLNSGTASGATGYYSYPQANFYRRITALVPGLTDLPGNDYGDWVEGWNTDEWKPNGSFVAYNILRRPNGLQLNDRVTMQMLWMGSHYYGETSGTSSLSKPTSRTAITSAHPDGIAGTIVSREQDFYYGPGGVVVQNPYKDNALTIAAEVGTIVRGRPIAGRVFIELMGTDNGWSSIAEDADKRYWGGDLTNGVTADPRTWPSKWDYDSRRTKELKLDLTTTKARFDPTTGTFEYTQVTSFYFQYEDGTFLQNAYLPMTYRGLKWLSLTPQIEAGDARGFASAMNLTITTPAVTLDKTSSPASQVTGAMRLGLSVRQPANYADGNIEVDLFGGMEMSLEMRGLGRMVAAPPMSLTVTTPNPQLNVAADTVTVYLDEGRNITLFLKEDN